MTRPFPLPPALCNAVIAIGCCPSQRLAMQGTQAHPSSQRAACFLVGISKFSLEMKNWFRDEAVYPRPCWKLEAGTGVKTQIFSVLTQDCSHFSVWRRWTLLNWSCTVGLSTCGKTGLWDGHQSTVCVSRDRGLDKHQLQSGCCSPGDPH